MSLTKHAVVHKTFPFGTENTVSFAHKGPNTMRNKSNATTAQMDLTETLTATHVSLGFEEFNDCINSYNIVF